MPVILIIHWGRWETVSPFHVHLLVGFVDFLMNAISTKRLSLRPFLVDDAARVVSLVGDFEVARQTATMPHPLSLEYARDWITSIGYEGGMMLGIEREGQLIGKVGYIDYEPDGSDKSSSVEISYWLGKNYWGQGYAFEAASAIIPVIFDNYSINTIIAGHATDNPGSERIIDKLGFQLIGETMYYSLARDVDVPCLLYKLDRDEYLKRTKL